jgi:Domain of unknown function (DUF1707)
MLASDADRDRVVQALKDAYVLGRLTHDELDQRLAAALQARTTDETQALLVDLQPRPAPPPPLFTPQAPYPQQALAPFVSWWPALLVGIVVLGALDSHNLQFFWWMIFPAFFWFRGGRRRFRYRGPRL